jgi:hypothetical protein
VTSVGRERLEGGPALLSSRGTAAIVNTIVGGLGDLLVHRQALSFPTMGGTSNETDLFRRLEELVQGSEVWEIARRFRLHRYRRSDAEYQTVEVEMMFNRDIGWKIVATDAARDIATSGPPHRVLDVVMATVRWQDLDDQAVPPNDLATRKNERRAHSRRSE